MSKYQKGNTVQVEFCSFVSLEEHEDWPKIKIRHLIWNSHQSSGNYQKNKEKLSGVGESISTGAMIVLEVIFFVKEIILIFYAICISFASGNFC